MLDPKKLAQIKELIEQREAIDAKLAPLPAFAPETLLSLEGNGSSVDCM